MRDAEWKVEGWMRKKKIDQYFAVGKKKRSKKTILEEIRQLKLNLYEVDRLVWSKFERHNQFQVENAGCRMFFLEVFWCGKIRKNSLITKMLWIFETTKTRAALPASKMNNALTLEQFLTIRTDLYYCQIIPIDEPINKTRLI